MQFSIKNLLSDVIEDAQTDSEFLPLARRLHAGINARIQREIDRQITHRYQGDALLLKLFDAACRARKLADIQDARRDLTGGKDGLNARITKLALKLADLLRERETKEQRAHLTAVGRRAQDGKAPPIVCDSVIELINRAAELAPELKRHRYSNNLRPKLADLAYRFDTKYWPDQAGLIDAIAEFANERQYAPSDELGLLIDNHRQRNDSGDFLRLFVSHLDEIRGEPVGGDESGFVVFPCQFKMTAECLVDIHQILGFGEISAREVRQFLLAYN